MSFDLTASIIFCERCYEIICYTNDSPQLTARYCRIKKAPNTSAKRFFNTIQNLFGPHKEIECLTHHFIGN